MKNLDHITSLTELLELAVKDMEIIKKNPKYKFDVGEWHYYYKEDDKCSVCVAGSVIANTLKRDRMFSALTLADYRGRTAFLLRLLDDIRCYGFNNLYPPLSFCERTCSELEINGSDKLHKVLNMCCTTGLSKGHIRSWRKLLRECKKAGL